MLADSLCTDTKVFSVLPWALIVLYGLLTAWFLFLRMVRGSQVKLWAFFVGMAIVYGGIFYVRSKYAGEFLTLTTSADGATLTYFWPKAAAHVPKSAIEAVGVVRGRHFRKGSRVDDRAWLKVRAAGVTYSSCESQNIVAMIAAARDVASKLDQPITWQQRCPDNDGRWVASTEAEVSASGKMAIPAACSSAGK